MEKITAIMELGKLAILIIGLFIGFIIGLAGGAAGAGWIMHEAAKADEEYEDAVANDSGIL